MAKIVGKDFEAIKAMVETFMSNGDNRTDGQPKALSLVTTGSQAWDLAHRAGVTSYCYGDTSKDLPGIPDCVDAHIKTALAAIFPNAVFADKYSY